MKAIVDQLYPGAEVPNDENASTDLVDGNAMCRVVVIGMMQHGNQ